MKQVFDLLEEISRGVAEYIDRTGHPPRSLVLSPRSYRRVLEVMLTHPAHAGLLSTIRLVIDEVLPDTDIQLEA